MTLNRLKHKKFGVLLVNSFLSQRDDDSQLPEVLERIEEVVLASQDLPEVAQTIRRLSELTRTQFVLSFTVEERAAIKNAFACLICKGLLTRPC